MATRIDLELTSSRDDGTWTWRAAGAKQPKGVLDAALLPTGAKVGDVMKADAEYLVDGIEIVSVQAVKARKSNSLETLEILGSGKTEELVTTKLYKGGGREGGRGRGRDGGGGGRDGGRGGRDGGRGGGGRDGGGRGDSSRGGRDGGRGGRDGARRREQAPRLRPANVHRSAWVEKCSDVQRPIAEQLIEGGLPSVRSAIERQNTSAKADGKPEINGGALMAMAESLAPGLRTAEWRDRAEAAIAGVDKIDIRDLRSVVASAESGARDSESRGMADDLRTKINARLEREHAAWLKDIETAITDGRVVRALRSSARPAKPGTPMPKELATKLIDATNEALSEEEEPGRWATVLDAVAFSPIREFVVPSGVPDLEDRELVAAVKKLSNRVPQVAALFGIEPRPESRPGRKKGKKKPAGDAGAKKAATDEAGAAKPDTKPETKAPEAAAVSDAEPAAQPAAEPETAEAPVEAPESAPDAAPVAEQPVAEAAAETASEGETEPTAAPVEGDAAEQA